MCLIQFEAYWQQHHHGVIVKLNQGLKPALPPYHIGISSRAESHEGSPSHDTTVGEKYVPEFTLDHVPEPQGTYSSGYKTMTREFIYANDNDNDDRLPIERDHRHTNEIVIRTSK